MFIILNKDKILAYIVSVLTVLVLFGVANFTVKDEVIETSSNVTATLPIYNVQTEENKIAFTMNCAWSADDIEDILETLRSNEVKITFFMVGDWINKNPETVKKIYDEGHEIGNHSDTHPHVTQLTYEQNLEEIEKCSQKIEQLTGEKPTLYRAPYGEYNETVISASLENGYYPIQWNKDTLDYNALTGEQMWKRIGNNLQNGDIILSHNGTAHTADSLDMLIKKIKEQGFEIVKVSDLIYKENYKIDNNGTQIKN